MYSLEIAILEYIILSNSYFKDKTLGKNQWENISLGDMI